MCRDTESGSKSAGSQIRAYTLRQILEFLQKWNLRFGGNLDFRVADILRAEPPLLRIRFCGNF